MMIKSNNSLIRSNANLSKDGKIGGSYELERTIGKGNYAIVKLASHVFTGEKVAVKVIDKAKLDTISKIQLFQEVRCMKLVQHPNVVKLYEVIDTQSKLYLILELGEGGDLYDYILKHDKGIDENKAKEYFRQILKAIIYCHKLHVVHRDLKPENVIFFDNYETVKLTDFGFSNKFKPGEKLVTSCGSLAYSAPEILLGDHYDAQAIDIWSLGVLLYMLVAGKCPFLENNDNETITMIIDCKYTMPPHISRECKNLIQKMLVKDPNKRAKLDEILHDPWLTKGQTKAQALEEPTSLCRSDVQEEDHKEIVKKMVEGEIATEPEINRSLELDSYNHVTATYYLLAEKLIKRREQHGGGGPNSEAPAPPPSGPLSGDPLTTSSISPTPRMYRSYSTGLRCTPFNALPPPPAGGWNRRTSPIMGVSLPPSGSGLMNRSRSTPRLSPHPSTGHALICGGYVAPVHKMVPEEKYPSFPRTSLAKVKSFKMIQNSVPTKIFEEAEEYECGFDEDDSIDSESIAEPDSPALSRTDIPVSGPNELQRSQMTHVFNRLDKFRFSPSFNTLGPSVLDKSTISNSSSSHHDMGSLVSGGGHLLFTQQKRQSSLKDSLFANAGSSLEEILEEDADNEYMDASTEPEWVGLTSSQTLPSAKKPAGRPTILAPPFLNNYSTLEKAKSVNTETLSPTKPPIISIKLPNGQFDTALLNKEDVAKK